MIFNHVFDAVVAFIFTCGKLRFCISKKTSFSFLSNEFTLDGFSEEFYVFYFSD